MPILDIQRRARELGRIRIGQKGEKGQPEKLDRFRLTSASQALIEKVAALYGGTPQEWTPQGGAAQWEVITEAKRIPILVPPQPVTQWLEAWTAGGCVHRCDGVTEMISGEPCDLGPDHLAAKPTTRLNVVLKDVEGIGVWRLESHGWNAAVELPDAAAFLARAGGYVDGWLSLEERVSKSEGQTRRYIVPILDIDVTPAELLAGGGAAPIPVEGGPVRPAIEGARPDYLAEAKECLTADAVRAVWTRARDAGHMDDDLQAALLDIAQGLAGPNSEDPDALWVQIVSACPPDWTIPQLEEDFASKNDGTPPESATAEQLRGYLEQMTAVPA